MASVICLYCHASHDDCDVKFCEEQLYKDIRKIGTTLFGSGGYENFKREYPSLARIYQRIDNKKLGFEVTE